MARRKEPLTNEPIALADLSAALTHHWLVRRRGGEKVLEALAELLPRAPIYTLIADRDGMRSSPLADRQIHTSLLQRLPGATRHYPRLLPLLPAAARGVRLPDVDLVVCSDAAITKAMRASSRSTIVCYCHSPMRYAFEPELHRAYRLSLPPLLRPLFSAAVAHARSVDRRAADRVDVFVANSAHVAARIERAYGRVARVVHPPVEIPDAAPTASERSDEYLCLGYHTPYKKLDLAVEACGRLGRRLVVVGTGPEVDRLRARKPPHVELLGWLPDEEVERRLGSARGLLFPGEEDFGIVPVEAYSRGCPVVAYGVGGATESVFRGVCGEWFEEPTAASLAAAIERSEKMRFDPIEMYREAQRFSRPRFLREMEDVLRQAVESSERR